MWIKFCDQQPPPKPKRYLVAIKRKTNWGKKVTWSQRVMSWDSYLASAGDTKYKFNTGAIPYKEIIYWHQLPGNPVE